MEYPSRPIDPTTNPEVPTSETAQVAELIENQGGIAARWQAVKTGIEVAVVAAEVTPVNEALRFGAFGAAVAADMPPTVSGAVLGAATLLIEGGAAWSTADLLGSNRGQKVMGWIRERTAKIIPENARMTPLTEAGVALVGGTSVVMLEKQREDPDRTVRQNRIHGLRTASWLAGALALEGTLIAEGVETPQPVTVGAAILGAAGLVGAARWARNRLARNHEDSIGQRHKPVNNGESPQGLGLSPEDEEGAILDARTVSVEENGKTVPVLVPIDRLYWYNKDYLRRRFETDDIYYYAHPDIQDEQARTEVYERVAEMVSAGGVVLYDTVTAGETVYGDLDHELTEYGKDLNKVALTTDGKQRFLLQYDGQLIIGGDESKPFKETTPVYQAYQEAIEQGVISVDLENGPALIDVIDGEEAERLWNIYKKPFERLSDSHPINSGYTREGFMDVLKDPEAVKAIYRVNGELTTLAMFTNDPAHFSWLDPRYYEATYPEAVKTGNHFVFPGIVTDEGRRGASYSVPLMKLIARVQAFRDTPAVISFECTDISYAYIPKIVRYALGRSGAGKTKGFEEPVSRFDYYAITK